MAENAWLVAGNVWNIRKRLLLLKSVVGLANVGFQSAVGTCIEHGLLRFQTGYYMMKMRAVVRKHVKMLENESGCWNWATLVALVFVYCLCVPLSLSLFVLITWFSLSESQAV